MRAKLNFSASIALQKSPRIVLPWVKLSLLFAYYYMGNWTQGSYGSWKTWKVLEFCFDIFQVWKVLEKDYRSQKILEICLTQAIRFSECTLKEMIVRLLGELILKLWEWEGVRWNLESWKIHLSLKKVLKKCVKFLSQKGYEPCEHHAEGWIRFKYHALNFLFPS